MNYDITCQPIYEFIIALSPTESRAFSCYGDPYRGGAMEDGKGAIPPAVVDLFEAFVLFTRTAPQPAVPAKTAPAKIA